MSSRDKKLHQMNIAIKLLDNILHYKGYLNHHTTLSIVFGFTRKNNVSNLTYNRVRRVQDYLLVPCNFNYIRKLKIVITLSQGD